VGDLQFREAVLPPASILASGDEMRKTMTLVWSHAEAVVLAIRAAILRRSYETAREYAAERWQGGKIIIEHSLVRQMLADIHLASCQIDDAWKGMVTAIEPGKPLRTGQLAVSLRFAAELPKLTSDGIQLLGGNGYMEDFGQERLFRDAKQCEMLLGHPQAKRFSAWEQV
jgi:alkylation response protein AidB-like acyl-CoA dehydrogenase